MRLITPPFACSIAILKQNHHAVASLDDPVLQHHQLGLQAQKFPKVPGSFIDSRIICGTFFTPAIIQFKLQLFVQVIEQVFT
jgi:hypothetical protein